mgnify:CR=1 FL=1
MGRTGAHILVETLADEGVEVIFGYPGGAVLDIFAELYHSPMKFVLCRHEQGATHMADGYARPRGLSSRKRGRSGLRIFAFRS